MNLDSVGRSLQLMEVSGGRRSREGNGPMGSCLQRPQQDSRFSGCSEMGPPTDTLRGLVLETTVEADFARILVCIHVLPWPVNVMTFPLQSQGLTELGKVFLSCSRKAIETCSQAQRVVCWRYSLQNSLGIMKDMNKQSSIYGDTGMTLILFLSALRTVSF